MSAEPGLRYRARWVSPTDGKLLIEAADEIGRLRAALKRIAGGYAAISGQQIAREALNGTAEG